MTTPTQPDQVVPDVLAPAMLGPVRMRNRIIKAATYENMARGGLVTDRLVEFHREVASGGIGMTTVAYCAVTLDGRTDSEQIVWRDEAVPGLRALTEAVHNEGAAVSTQIGHSGPCANSNLTGHPALGPSRSLNMLSLKRCHSATVADLDRIVAAYGHAATMAIETGFDAVEVHVGHNYLLSSFLSPDMNKRDDEYGGNLANRARLALRALKAVREAAGSRLGIIAKVNMDDGRPGGFWLEEAMQLAQWIEASGDADALEMTVGSSLKDPMYLFRGEAPLHELAQVLPATHRLGMKLLGKKYMRTYPYQPAYLMHDSLQIRDIVSMPMILLGGITDIETMDQAMANGFQYVAMGRAMLREPDLINKLYNDRGTRSLCNHNNKCMVSSLHGTRCVLRPPSDNPPGDPNPIR